MDVLKPSSQRCAHPDSRTIIAQCPGCYTASLFVHKHYLRLSMQLCQQCALLMFAGFDECSEAAEEAQSLGGWRQRSFGKLKSLLRWSSYRETHRIWIHTYTRIIRFVCVTKKTFVIMWVGTQRGTTVARDGQLRKGACGVITSSLKCAMANSHTQRVPFARHAFDRNE